jgi:acetyltransferase-like isoleucine patch superfamily enzyme
VTATSLARVHPTAILEAGVTLGPGTSVWDGVHIRHGAQIGADCIVGEKTYIAYDVRIGDRCKINAMVYICAAVTLETGVMISAGTVFTNDRFPRATTPELDRLRSSDPDEETLETLVREGATIGANCTIGSGFAIGRFAMVGMGAVVTRAVPDFHLVHGSPARTAGFVCRCGPIMHRIGPGEVFSGTLHCSHCGRDYVVNANEVSETQ